MPSMYESALLQEILPTQKMCKEAMLSILKDCPDYTRNLQKNMLTPNYNSIYSGILGEEYGLNLFNKKPSLTDNTINGTDGLKGAYRNPLIGVMLGQVYKS